MTLQVGKYVAQAISAELGVADTGTELVAVLFEIVEGECKGEKVTWRGYFTEKTQRRAIESLKHCGWRGDWETFDGIGDCEVQLDVQEDRDMRTGEFRGTRVAWVNPSRTGVKNSMDAATRAQFAARMKGVVSEVLGPSARPARPVQQPRPAVARQPVAAPVPDYEPEGDEIPF